MAWPHVAVRSDTEIYAPSACARDLVVRKQMSAPGHWRVLDRGDTVPSRTPLGAALPHLGGIELEPVLGYNSFDVRRYKEYLQFVADLDAPIRPREGAFGYPIIEAFPIRNKTLLDLLGTRFLLQPNRLERPARASGEPRQDQSWLKVLEDDSPMAYSFLSPGGM